MKVQLEQSFTYELNTRIFCSENSCTLDSFPESFFLSKEFLACDFLWLMGIWMPSPASKKICDTHAGLRNEFAKALPDFTQKDIIGSPYAIYLYEPNKNIASSLDEIVRFKNKINSLGKKLILDFVPNHMSIDTPLIAEDQNFFLQGTITDAENQNFFYHETGTIFAHGKDPYFDGWTDTIQWDFSNPKVVEKHIEIVEKISTLCDGIRCDMAMLPVENIFFKTHGKKANPYWKVITSKIKSIKRDFVFIAEVYWNMEYELQMQGFDFTYDKELYDRMKKNPSEIHSHLNAEITYQKKSLRFIENHDEERALEAFNENSIFFFSLLAFLPGMILFHDGQTNSLKSKLPVQLGRKTKEKINSKIQEYYNRALNAIIDRKGKLLEQERYSITSYCENDGSKIVAISIFEKIQESNKCELLIFNPYPNTFKGKLAISGTLQSWLGSQEREEFFFQDLIDAQNYARTKVDLFTNGLYLELESLQAHWFIFTC